MLRRRARRREHQEPAMSQDTKDFQGQLAALFQRLLNEEGPKVTAHEGANAMAGIAALGAEHLYAVLDAIPDAVERDIAKHSKRFDYQIIPVDAAEPIRRGMVMLPEQPST